MKSKGNSRRFRRPWWLASLGVALLTLALTAVLAGAQSPSDGEAIFKTKCVSCHTIGGGRLVGPDLKGVTTRTDPKWLASWIKAPDKMLAAGDPTATQLLAEYSNIPMPNLTLQDTEVAALIAYFQSVDGPPAPAPTQASAPAASSPTQAAPASTQAAVPAAQPANNAALVLALNGDPNYGEKIYRGEVAPLNGGLNCIACHSVEGVVPLGGGALGPDLTHVFARYGGRAGLAAVLGTLPFPTMQGVFATRPLTVSEQADLLAFFERADGLGAPQTQLHFQLALGIGSGLALILFIGMLFFWPRQTMGIAQRLRRYGKL